MLTHKMHSGLLDAWEPQNILYSLLQIECLQLLEEDSEPGHAFVASGTKASLTPGPVIPKEQHNGNSLKVW